MSGISNETLQADHRAWGRWVESAVGAHLVNQAFKEKKLTIYYWREGNEEVDFVEEYKNESLFLKSRPPKLVDLQA